MRTKKPLIIALFLCTWSFVSYFLLIRQTTSDSRRKSPTNSLAQNGLNDVSQIHELQRKLNQLEENIQVEAKLHDQLVRDLLAVIRFSGQNMRSKTEPFIVDIVKHAEVEEADKPKVLVGQITNLDAIRMNEIDDRNAGPVSTNQNILADEQVIVHQKLGKLTSDGLTAIDFSGPVIAVLVFACNRVSVRNCLENLIQHRPNARQFPIIVSQVSHVHVKKAE